MSVEIHHAFPPPQMLFGGDPSGIAASSALLERRYRAGGAMQSWLVCNNYTV